MHDLVLALHSITRWLVIIIGLVAVGRALQGWLGGRNWQGADDRLGVAFSSIMDLQLLLGLLLYFVFSDITAAALRDFAGAMGNPALRYWAVEHLALMLVAVVLAHVGRSASKRAATATGKHKRAAIFFGLSMLAILAAIPWPFFSYGRPLLPF